jgi:hypothetical protein
MRPHSQQMSNFKFIHFGLVVALLALALSGGSARQTHSRMITGNVGAGGNPQTDNSRTPFGIPARPLPQEEKEIYYSLRPDLRRCAFPLCGGYFVKRVNHSLTRCVDGKYMKECYVAEIDWNGQPAVEARARLLRGQLVSKNYQGLRRLGELRVSESWFATHGTAAGDFYRVKDRGVRCITHPCLTHQQSMLNSNAVLDIAGVDFSSGGAAASKVSEALEVMERPDGLIVSGSNTPVTGPAGDYLMLKAASFYIRAMRSKGSKPVKGCIRTGCSSQVCSDSDVITTCEWRPEYACYKRARCERQADGKCGFTMTAALKACLAQP